MATRHRHIWTTMSPARCVECRRRPLPLRRRVAMALSLWTLNIRYRLGWLR